MEHYKTTASGLILGGLTAIKPIITNGDFDVKRDWFHLVIAAAVAILGILAHDPKQSV